MACPRDGAVTSADDLAGLLADMAGQPGTVVLTQASTPTEARLIRERIAAAGGSSVPPVSPGPAGEGLPRSLLDGDEDVRLVPVRVAWLPEEHAGRRVARVADLRPGHDPYHPSERQQQRILARQPGRAVVLAGEPATLGSLRQRWAETTDDDDFAAYVARRATLTLDQAEYRLRGPRYKTPSLVKDEILSSRRFRNGLRAVRRGPDGSPASLEEAGEILDELAAGWSRRLIDVMPTVGRLIFQRGFDPQIDYDESQVERVRAAMERHPGIFLWSHRSNLDTLVLSAAMQELGLPPAHLFAGINMAFGPMGALMRRARRDLHPPLDQRRPAVQVRAARVRRVRARETVQPFLVHRRHPVADGEGAAAAARPAVLRRRRLPVRAGGRHRAAAGVDHVRPAARDLRVRRLRQGRDEEAGRVRLAVRLHQGAGGAPLRQGLRAVRRAVAAVFVPRTCRWCGGS